MTKPADEWRLPTRRLGHRVLLFDRLDSTNTFAASLSDDPDNDGVVILARDQTAGRGQHGRSWVCPPGDGILMSVLLFPPPPLRRPVLLTAWAAVSVCEAILELTGLQAKIKWPNDVLVRGRKVCGILIEQGRGTVAGIGLNLNQAAADFQLPGLEFAGSLALFAGQTLDRLHAARVLIRHLDDEYDRLCQGDLDTLEACWKWRLGLLGRTVTAECHDGLYGGRLWDVGWGGLLLETAAGPLCLPPETVRHLREEAGR